MPTKPAGVRPVPVPSPNPRQSVKTSEITVPYTSGQADAQLRQTFLLTSTNFGEDQSDRPHPLPSVKRAGVGPANTGIIADCFLQALKVGGVDKGQASLAGAGRFPADDLDIVRIGQLRQDQELAGQLIADVGLQRKVLAGVFSSAGTGIYLRGVSGNPLSEEHGCPGNVVTSSRSRRSPGFDSISWRRSRFPNLPGEPWFTGGPLPAGPAGEAARREWSADAADIPE